MQFNQSFLQSDIWGTFRETQGWRAHRAAGVLVLERPLPMSKTLLYSPETTAPVEILLELLPSIKEIAERRNSIVFRLELLIDKADPIAERWQAGLVYAGFIRAFETVQPADRQIVTLGDGEAVLATMKQKGRYNIKVAEKSGVMVRETSAKGLQSDVTLFYSLMQATAKREKFSIRGEDYFQALAETLYSQNCGRVFVATYNNQPIAAAIVTHYNGLAAYVYGASSREYREVMAPYAMHWAVMQWAAHAGATHYDLLAISPEDGAPRGLFVRKRHKFDGITQFKQQFGGEAVHLLGCWDLVIQPGWYQMFKLAEKIRR